MIESIGIHELFISFENLIIGFNNYVTQLISLGVLKFLMKMFIIQILPTWLSKYKDIFIRNTKKISIMLQGFGEFINCRVKSLLDDKRLNNNMNKFGVDQPEK